jgi:hypothetical protein
MELDPKSVFGDEIFVTLSSGLARCSSGCGQILDDEPQMSPRQTPIFHKRPTGQERTSAAFFESKLRSCFYPFRDCANTV